MKCAAALQRRVELQIGGPSSSSEWAIMFDV